MAQEHVPATPATADTPIAPADETPATPTASANGSANLPLIERMVEIGAFLIKLRTGVKQPTGEGWKLAPVLTASEADAWTQRGGNLGVNLGPSKLIAFDCEDLAATQAVVRCGFNPTVAPAKHAFDGTFNPDADDREAGQPNKKVGGSHTWLRVPDYVDASLLSSDHSMQIKLPGGGTMDVLAGARYVVAPPSALDLTYGTRYAPFNGGALDLTIAPQIMDAPRWLFDLSVPCPEELAPLHGCLIPRVREKVEQDARSVELTNQIDEIGWDEWIAGDHRIMLTGQVDGCGCDIGHFQGASSEKSMTLHDGCAQGYGIHIWSGMGDECVPPSPHR
ncbi:bifunctional DNA primase/polymerase [Mycobacteroides abscessus]|uniref:bifunctional DNA primase/polymerase n=1 Tax=Mycobacteroides abscessus TaxID=36809 RepID=UPI00266FBF37|nr:bifunctional DNA primase/polymerase [Mycobacteroides abscessus]MDO3110467.1 bifunctional DNA primase/polymerase [Mycobacteroides abscessus subsp. abscessus]